jgi:BMFP domain-containing protein YqiC
VLEVYQDIYSASFTPEEFLQKAQQIQDSWPQVFSPEVKRNIDKMIQKHTTVQNEIKDLVNRSS